MCIREHITTPIHSYTHSKVSSNAQTIPVDLTRKRRRYAP